MNNMQKMKGKLHWSNPKGFTLIELLIVIVIVALLITLAIPSYTAWIRKANRGEAQQLLMNWANNQEIWRTNNTTYAAVGSIAAPTHANFDFSVSGITPNTYTLTATAKGSQLKDKERGTLCSPLTLNQSHAKSPAICW